MSEDNEKQYQKPKQNWFQKRYEDKRYHKNQKYINPKIDEPYQKSKPVQLDQNFLKIMQNHLLCFNKDKITVREQINILPEDCFAVQLKVEQKPRKKSDIYMPIQPTRTNYYQDQEDLEPEWMNDDQLIPGLEDYQTKTLEYEFKKVLNVNKTLSQKFDPKKPGFLSSQLPGKKLDQDFLVEKMSADKLQRPDKYFQKKYVPSQEEVETQSESDSDETIFLKLCEISRKRLQELKKEQEVKDVNLQFDKLPIYSDLLKKCAQLFDPFKDYNKLKIFINFTRQLTNIDINENTWFYEDPQGKIQGPFSSVDMDVWNLDQYFPKNLLISWKQTKQFITINEFRENAIRIFESAYDHVSNLQQFIKIELNQFTQKQNPMAQNKQIETQLSDQFKVQKNKQFIKFDFESSNQQNGIHDLQINQNIQKQNQQNTFTSSKNQELQSQSINFNYDKSDLDFIQKYDNIYNKNTKLDNLQNQFFDQNNNNYMDLFMDQQNNQQSLNYVNQQKNYTNLDQDTNDLFFKLLDQNENKKEQMKKIDIHQDSMSFGKQKGFLEKDLNNILEVKQSQFFNF